MTKTFTLHSITIENDEQEVFARFNDSESFHDYMIDLNMDLSRDDDEGYPKDYMNHIHVFYNVILSDNEIHGLDKNQYNKLLSGELSWQRT